MARAVEVTQSMKSIFWLALVLVPFSMPGLQQTPSPTDSIAQASPVFRDPFTLKLKLDHGDTYLEHFDKVPYVADNVVYLFAGDNFGINLSANGDEISGLTYQKDPGRSDMVFKFTQEKDNAGRFMMLLTISSKLKRQVFLDALMTVPGKKGIYKTSILPVGPGLSNFESWPHPIVQLALRNFHLSQK